MSKFDEQINTGESSSVIQTDEVQRGEKGDQGERGYQGDKGEKGDKGDKGDQGERGEKGDSIKGDKGDRGDDGKDGNHGVHGKDGTIWFYFKKALDHEAGKIGDFCIIESTSQFFRKEDSAGQVLWKYKGNLKGKDGEKGEKGERGERGSGGGGTIIQQVAGGGGDFEETYETVSKNLKTFPYALTYTSGKLTRIEYTTDVGTIIKDFTYTGDLLTQIELSGDIPSGIKTKKAFTYDVSNVLTSISYT